ncbi:phosphomannomutase/phosphoglucomutase [Gilvimarinus xylanilyticus]|uniref:phosphomannomutase n=1 Tax=Gilvimarinus xylanilyticus TaxID=2944139 RepID=A0A9X2HYC8_9GAMM|nr:phosphomannomutase/phosphoglucomutase [Gilvimarinus xylanilyticus]MCP8899974.1 phosphomannomutase/phosphoglucomutase [Gilvimarinus xylanilyticus]
MSEKPGTPTSEDNHVDPQPKMTRGEKRAREARKKLHARRHKLLFILVGISLLANALLAYVLHDSMVIEKQRLRVEQAAQQAAEQRAEIITQYLQEKTAQVEQWAANPELEPALENRDSQALDTLLATLSQAEPDLLALRAYPQGEISLDREHSAPVRYAELDLVRRSTRRQTTLAEVSPLTETWQIHIARPIPLQGERIATGSLLATFGPQALQAPLEKQAQHLGRTEVLQSFAGHQPVNLVTLGQGDAAPAAEVDIADSYLSVRFTPSAALVDQSAELPGMWILTISLSVTLCLALALILSRLLIRTKPGSEGEGLVLPQQYKDSRESSTEDTPETPVEPAAAGQLYQSKDILDIEVIEEDADILGLDTAQPRKKAPTAPPASKPRAEVPKHLFRAYDIRGKVSDGLTAELAHSVGLALGSEAQDQGETSIVVARDGRIHSPELCQALVEGIRASGCDVINIGVVPTPLMHFAVCEMPETNSGVMVTASHNNADYNGFKMVINGETLSEKAIEDIRSRIERRHYLEGEGKETHEEITPDYIDRIFSDVALAGQISVVIDAGNAVTGVVAPQLFEELGCDVIPLHCELDGNFPNHQPDPTIEANLQDLLAKVKDTGADLGLAFDGDGDRLIVVTPAGRIIWPDQLLMLFAKDILSRNPGADVLFDVKCSKQLNQLISSYGGRPIMWKTGHSHMKHKMLETGALIGGEYSGHIFIKERWYGFDDGLYAAARLLEIITLRDQAIDDIFAAFPMLPNTPEIRVAVPEAEKFALIDQLIEQGNFQNGKPTTIDGLRVDFSKGWGLVRASNTGAEITLRFEADSEETLAKIQKLFKRELLKVNKNLQLDF